MSYSVDVSGISPETTETQLQDFFNFCGAIEKIDFKGTEGPSTIYFEKASAVSTALLLNGGTLNGVQITVAAEEEPKDEVEANSLFHHHHKDPVSQADKPRAGIVAEYLAKGYKLSDSILQHAIDLDNKKGISKSFLEYFHDLDAKVGEKALGHDQTLSGKLKDELEHATEKARAIDEKKGISKSAHDYYLRAISSPIGSKVKDFYTKTSKEIADIHEEAKRIADANKGNVATPATPGSGHPTEPKPEEPATA